MANKKESQVMRDFAASDPRSAKAWLNGRGDGRNARFEEFAKQKGSPVGDSVHTEFQQKVRVEDGFDHLELEPNLPPIDAGKPSFNFVQQVMVPMVGLALGVGLAHFWSG